MAPRGLSVKRRRRGKGFSYEGTSERTIRDARRIERIEAMAIPPAWRGVRISEKPNARILATGRDQKARRQYIYNADYRAKRERAKYRRLANFARLLPRLRARLLKDARGGAGDADGDPRDRVAALCARLIDLTGIRAGSVGYRDLNGTFGATTLRKRHVTIDKDAGTATIAFRAKGGKDTVVTVRDPLLISGLTDLMATPGRNLFRYRQQQGGWTTLKAGDLNRYLRRLSGERISAKSFRLWRATTLTAARLVENGKGTPLAPAIGEAARELGNTPAIVRGSYLHPRVIETHKSGRLEKIAAEASGAPHMPAIERATATVIDADKQDG